MEELGICPGCSKEAGNCSCTGHANSSEALASSRSPAAKKRRIGDSTFGRSTISSNAGPARQPEDALIRNRKAVSLNVLNDSAIALAGQEQWYFENIYTVAAPSVALHGADRYLQTWLELTLGTISMIKRPQFLDSALRALALINVIQRSPGPGQEFKMDSSMAKEESFYQYHQALATLTPGIQQMERNASSPHALSATMLLTYFEMFACTSDDAWYTHANGAETLVRMRGTTRTLLTPEAQAMFMAFRPPLVVSAMLNGTPCFLADEEWRRVTNAIHLKQTDRTYLTDVSEQVYDAFAQLPGLMAQVSTTTQLLRESQEQQTVGYAVRVLSELLQHRWNLESVFEGFMRNLQAHGEQPHISGISGPFWQSMTAPSLLPFARPLVGSILCLIWSTKILLNAQLASLHKSLGDALPRPSDGEAQKAGSQTSIAQLRSENTVLAMSVYNAIKSIGTHDVPGHLGHSLKIAYYALESSPTSQGRAGVRIKDIARYFPATSIGTSKQERRLKALASIE